jgi:hypothetical protein
VQLSLAALLTPAWLIGEWAVRSGDTARAGAIAAAYATVLAAVYLSARTESQAGPERRALAWIGGLALIPCAIVQIVMFGELRGQQAASGVEVLGWVVAIGSPLGLAWLLRNRAAWVNAVAAGCVIVLGLTAHARGAALVYLWAAVCAAALAAWGVSERRPERINLGIAGFALAVLFFYFSTLMDKLGRSVSLIVLGLVVLAGGWVLERTRRRLIAGTRSV